MIRRRLLAASTTTAVALACSGGGGTVSRFAPCESSDICPSGTVCEAVLPTGTNSQTAGPTFCTWSCSQNDFGGQSCPADPNGAPGVCVASLNGTPVGSEYSYGFCFQDCSAGAACPSGEVCTPASTFQGGGGSTMVCVATSQDHLSGTSWESSTLSHQAIVDGVMTSSYRITFGPTNGTADGYASGPFNATLTLVFSPSATLYAGCTETTTFSGGTWVDVPPGSGTPGTIGVSDVIGSTNRTGCIDPVSDVMGAPSDYDDNVNGQQGATYSFDGSTMTLQSNGGVTPYGTDGSPWTFAKM